MALAIRVLQTAVVTGEDGTLALVSTQAVPAGATLVLIGTGMHAGATAAAPYLNSVADTQTNIVGCASIRAGFFYGRVSRWQH